MKKIFVITEANEPNLYYSGKDFSGLYKAIQYDTEADAITEIEDISKTWIGLYFIIVTLYKRERLSSQDI